MTQETPDAVECVEPRASDQPIPTGLSEEVIRGIAERFEQIARDLLKSSGQHDNGFKPLDLVALTQKLGGEVVLQGASELSRSDDGSIVVKPNGKFSIYLPKFSSRFSRNYTIAHELGHYILHRKENRPMRAARFGFASKDPGVVRAETECHVFTRAFLVPSSALREEYHRLMLLWPFPALLLVLSGTFGVTPQHMSERIQELGLDVRTP